MADIKNRSDFMAVELLTTKRLSSSPEIFNLPFTLNTPNLPKIAYYRCSSSYVLPLRLVPMTFPSKATAGAIYICIG
uniref:Uncharacterized protein n=1 Tax=Oryza barthii TaxID=65489 RepID=A0A0D3HUG8_9ORYZ